MSNLAIYQKGSDVISRFLIGCHRIGNDFFGDPASPAGYTKKVTGAKPAVWDVRWTDDVAVPQIDGVGHVVGWDKKISELSLSQENLEIDAIDDVMLKQAISKGRELVSYTYAQVDSYVTVNVSDPGTAKVLKFFGKILLALVKLNWWILRKNMR